MDHSNNDLMTSGALPNALPHLCVAVDDSLAAGHAKRTVLNENDLLIMAKICVNLQHEYRTLNKTGKGGFWELVATLLQQQIRKTKPYQNCSERMENEESCCRKKGSRCYI